MMSVEKKDIHLHLLPPFPEYQSNYPSFTIRLAVTVKVENDFRQTLYHAYGPPQMTHEDFEQDITEGWYTRDNCLVMYDGETPVAAGQIRIENNGDKLIGYLDTLGVPKALQDKGYGAELTKKRIYMLAAKGVNEIRTEVDEINAPMIRLLKKLGFTQSEPVSQA